MKTKFFKNLSLVLVVAMVLSLFVPTVGAFAASKVKLNSTKKYLHLGRDDANEYNFNIKSTKQKGWKYFWESANEAVAEVNEKNGVTTATGVGTTKVTVTITDKDGEEVDVVSATVIVRDNIEEVTVKNPVEKLAVGEEHDYNRNFKTESGSSKKTSSITRWTVEPAEGATIDDKGVFVATAAGEYTVKALAFQSKAKYADWKADSEKYADYVLDTDVTKVVVSADIVAVKQVNKTKFTVEFNTDMSDTDLSDKTAMVYQIINGKQYNTGTEKIKGLSLDATGKIATVEVYGNLYSKTEYLFAYGELKDGFTAASNEISEIAAIVFDDFLVKTDGSSIDMRNKVNAVNKDGVIILTGKDLGANLTFDYKGDYSYSWISGYNAYVSKEGHNAQIMAKYENFILNKDTNVYENVKFEDSAVATGVKILLSNTTMEYAVKTGAEPSVSDGSKWSTSGFTVPATDGSYNVYTRYKNNTDNSWDGYRSGATKFKYVSTDSDKLVIHGNMLYPAVPGVVTILVEDLQNDNATVGAFDLTIVSARGYASVEVDKQSVSLGNYDFSASPSDQEKATIVVTSKDTLGSNLMPGFDTTLTKVYSPSVAADTAVVLPTVTAALKNAYAGPSDGDYGKIAITVEAPGANKGSYQYKMNVNYNDTVKTVNIFVNVLDGSVADATKPWESVVRWAVEFDSKDVDLKKLEATKDVKANVYGYNSNNARVYALANTAYNLQVLRGDNDKNITTIYGSSSANIRLDGTTAQKVPVAYDASFATGNGLDFVDLASYVVTAKATAANGPTTRPAGGTIAVQTFTVKDTTTLVPVLENWSVSANSFGTVDTAIREAFKFNINDAPVPEGPGVFTYKATKGGAITEVDGSAAVAEGDNIRVEEVYYITNWNGSSKYIKYTFKVNQTITISK